MRRSRPQPPGALILRFPFSVSSLSRLGNDVEHDRFALLHFFDPALERWSKVLRIADRAFGVHTVGLCHLRVIDVGLAQRGTDMRAVDAAIALAAHLLHEHHFLMVSTVVV